jgi:hypothetical protein
VQLSPTGKLVAKACNGNVNASLPPAASTERHVSDQLHMHAVLQELLYDKQKLLDNGDRCFLSPHASLLVCLHQLLPS